MRIGFTDHAVDRYIQHYLKPLRDQQIRAREMGDETAEIPPERTRVEVRAILDEHSPSAVKLRTKTIKGDTQWEIAALGIVCVTKPDRNSSTGLGEHVCVTILPPLDPRGMTEFEMELLQARVDEFHAQEEKLRQEQTNEKVEKARIEQAPKNSFPTTQRKEEVLNNRRQRIDELGKQILLVEWEKKIVGDLLKTVRTKVTNDRNVFDAKEALRLAIKFIQGQDTPEAKAVLERIEGIQAGFVTPAFYNLEVERKSA